MRVSRIVRRFRVSGLLLCLLFGLALVASPSFAQGVPIQIGQNTIGTLSAEVSTAQYSLTATGGETVMIQVLTLSSGAAPSFRVLNPAGIEVLSLSNPEAKASLTGTITFHDPGVYTVVVAATNGSSGQFVLSLQLGAPQPEPTTLILDQRLSATVGSAVPVQSFRFTMPSAGAAALTVVSQSPAAGALVTLYNESAGKTIASSDGSVLGVSYQLPANGQAYRVEVRANAAGETPFTICVGACSGGLSGSAVAVPPPVSETTLPTAPAANAPCTASSSAGGTANLRSGPGTIYAILGGLPVGQSDPVLGIWTGGSWYQVDVFGQKLWVAASVSTLSGDCSNLPAIPAPVNAPLAPTPIPTATPIPQATATSEPSATPTETTAPDLPDLAVQGMTITQDSPTHARVTFDVFNRGTVDVTQPFYIYVCITALCVEKQVTLSVRAGSATNVFADLNNPSSTTPETVAIAVDSRGEIQELSEDNNITSLADVSLNF